LRSVVPALATWLVVAGAPAAADDAALGAFEALNRESRGAYAWARARVLEQQGPIILTDFDTLTLLDGARRETVETTPPLELPLKASAHAPLALFGLHAALGEAALGTVQIASLRRLAEALDRTSEALPKSQLSAEQRARIQTIVQCTRTRIESTCARGAIATEELNALAGEIRPAIAANIHDAARLKIDTYQAVVTRWRGQLGPERWGRLRVIVMGGQMPRKDNLTVQYFARLLGERGESKRIIYAESLFEEPRAMNLLGTHLIDSATAAILFGDPLRLDRDVLGDAAREYLESITP
jgi:hypothetical protein